MLVLRRKAGQTLLIGDDIEIEVLEVNSQSAKIGIRAPRSTSILRKELMLTKEQNQVAARAPSLSKLRQTMDQLRRVVNPVSR